MHPLDDPKYRVKYDLGGVSNSLAFLADQAEQSWRESSKIKIPNDYKTVKEVVMNGMGGSGLAGHVVEAAFGSRLRVPFFLTHSYGPPARVGKDSLYIVSSYSGETEEIISSYHIAKKQGAKIIGLAAGGEIGNLIKKGEIPGYVFSTKYNPSGRPRFALGYSIFGVLGLLQAAGVINIKNQEIAGMVETIKNVSKKFAPSSAFRKNSAKQLAQNLYGKFPVFVGAEFLEQSGRIISNQLHEGSKQFGFHFAIPELNHHLMEGLAMPRNLVRRLAFVFLLSDLYHPRVQKRFEITDAVVKKNKIPTYSYKLEGKTELEQIGEILSFGSYATYYLALLNKVDSSPNPWVDYFKEKLGR